VVDPVASAAPWIHRDPAAGLVTLDLHIQPGASRTGVAGVHGDRLKLRIHARPVEGEANRELLRFIADTLDVALRDVTLVRGASGRSKTVEVRGAAPAALTRLLQASAA
jgi:hypothetical protein